MTRPERILSVVCVVLAVLVIAQSVFDKWVVVQTVEAANRPTFVEPPCALPKGKP